MFWGSGSMLLKFFLENKIQTRFPAFATIMTVDEIADKPPDRHSIAVHLDIVIPQMKLLATNGNLQSGMKFLTPKEMLEVGVNHD